MAKSIPISVTDVLLDKIATGVIKTRWSLYATHKWMFFLIVTYKMNSSLLSSYFILNGLLYKFQLVWPTFGALSSNILPTNRLLLTYVGTVC